MAKRIRKNKSEVLGMSISQAVYHLQRRLIFKFFKDSGDKCFRCGKEIRTINEFSIDHKKPWLYEGKKWFWDLDNIAYSHRKCNTVHARSKHGSIEKSSHGCHCAKCRHTNTLRVRAYRSGMAPFR